MPLRTEQATAGNFLNQLGVDCIYTSKLNQPIKILNVDAIYSPINLLYWP